MSSRWHRVIGIDLGTTFSAVAAYNFDRQEVQIIKNRRNEPTTPSVLYVSREGRVSVGRDAKEKLARDPDGVILEVKRLMGERHGDRKALVQAPGRDQYEPEFISAHILKELKSCAERVIGEPVHDAVITVPAYFKESQKNATREAARIARLNPVLIVNEPTAAAVAYGIDSGERQTFAVYDFGGGTFDVSFVRVNDTESFDVLGTGGNANLGGGDIDAKIVEWALARMRRELPPMFAPDSRLLGKMRLEAERTKISLCSEGSPQEFVIVDPMPDVREVSYTLTPAEFDAMVQPLLESTFEQIEVALSSAQKQHGTTWDDIEAFILVGGSSKIPSVEHRLRERYKKPVRAEVNPDEVVAIGAGWLAKSKLPSTGPEIRDGVDRVIDPAAKPAAEHRDIRDVVSHTLGIGLKGDLYDALIPKDTVIPHRVVRENYTTSEDNQTSVFVPIYQGENPKASLNFKLGEVVIANITPEPKGTHKFSVTFALDADGIFEGEMRHQGTGVVQPVKLDRGQGQMTEKRRIDLAQQVQAGLVTLSSAAVASENTMIDALAKRLGEAFHRLPVKQQQECTDHLERLARAKAATPSVQADGIAQATMFLLRHQAM